MKLKTFLYRIPRPLKVFIFAILVIALALVYYIVLGCPTTFRQEFRRAEKVHMVGPSTIVETFHGEYTEFEKMIVGETEYGICFFGEYAYNEVNKEKRHYCFSYQEKTGDLTVAVPPNASAFDWAWPGFAQSFPVYVFTDDPEAVRAELKLTVTGEYTYYYHGKPEKEPVQCPLNRTLQAEAQRTDSGIFRFWLEAEDQPGLAALQYLSNAVGGNAYNITRLEKLSTISVTVRLYDAQDQLIHEEAQILYTAESE